MKNIIFFDGVCNVCDHTVDFVLKYDGEKNFYFSSLQTPFSSQFFREKNIEINLDTIVLFFDGEIYYRSDAMILILKHLKGFPKIIGYTLSIFPRFFRDFCYSTFAKYRYSLFGKKEVCKIPKKEHLNLFLE